MLQAALSCIDDAALALDEHGNVLDCNAQAEALGLAGMNAAKLRSAMTDTELRNFDDQQHPLTGALQGQRFDEIKVMLRIAETTSYLIKLSSRPFQQDSSTTDGTNASGAILLFKPVGSPQSNSTGTSINIAKKAASGVQPELEFFRKLFDLMPQLGWTAQADGYIDWYNQGWYDYTGTEFEEMQGWGWQKIHDKKMLPEVMSRWKESLYTGKPFEMKFPLRGKDGRFRCFLTRVNPIHNTEGKVERWVGINTNIQQEIDEANDVAASEHNFRTLAESIPQLVWVIDEQLSCRYLNQRWYDYTGQKAGTALGFNWQSIVHPEDLQNALKQWDICMKQGVSFQDKQRLRGRDGIYRWFLVRGEPVFHKDKQIVSWFGTCTDIQAEKERTELEQLHFRTIAEALPTAAWTTDASGHCDYLNTRWLEITGMSFDECIGEGWLKGLHPDDRDLAYVCWKAFIDDDKPYEIEYRLKVGDSYRWFLTRGMKVRDKHGKIEKIVGSTTDIHERKEQGEELERLVLERTAQLQTAINDAITAKHFSEKALEAKTRFLASISHEVRTPMASIMGFIELLSLNDLGEENNSMIHMSMTACKRLLQLLNDLLEAARLDHDSVKIDLRQISIKTLLESARQFAQSESSSKNLQVELKLAESLPKTIQADESLLRQVLLSLIVNAIKYTKEGKISISAQLQKDPAHSDKIVFTVSDTGCGIKSEMRSRIFEPFEQADSTTTQVNGGAGLGLTISKNLVELMQGEIGVNSEPGAGSTFWFSIPVVDDDIVGEWELRNE